MRILVTGANGFIGGWLCKELIKRHEVIGLTRGGTGYLKSHGIEDSVEILKGDLTELDTKIEADYCIHLAGMTDANECINNPLKAIRENVEGTNNLARICKEHGVRGMILASSTKVYGETDRDIADEESATNPTNLYGMTKLYSEWIARGMGNSIILRLANVYGPLDFNMERIIPNTIQNILGGRKPVIFGDGSTMRTMVNVKDVLPFFLLSLGMLERGESGTFNVAAEGPFSIKEIIEKISRIMEWKGGIEFRGDEKQAASDKKVSIEKARRTGWEPKISIEKGLIETVNSYNGLFG